MEHSDEQMPKVSNAIIDEIHDSFYRFDNWRFIEHCNEFLIGNLDLRLKLLYPEMFVFLEKIIF